MKYSARDLGIVTVYAALMLTKIEMLLILVIGTSVAAFVLIAFLFGATSQKWLADPSRRSGMRRVMFPLKVISIAWPVLAVASHFVLEQQRGRAESVAVAMLLGFAAASIPMLINMEVQRRPLNERTLWIGYWTLCASMTIAGLIAISYHWLQVHSGKAMNDDVYRWSSICGMIGSVFTTWSLSNDPLDQASP